MHQGDVCSNEICTQMVISTPWKSMIDTGVNGNVSRLSSCDPITKASVGGRGLQANISLTNLRSGPKCQLGVYALIIKICQYSLSDHSAEYCAWDSNIYAVD